MVEQGITVRPDSLAVVPTETAAARLKEVREFVKQELREGVDWGRIPGVPKPSLWQSGAEKIIEKLALAPHYVAISFGYEDWERGAFAVDILCRLVHYPTDTIVAESWGSAARDAQEEVNASNARRVMNKQDPRRLTMADKGLARNTAIKMSQKSGLVAATLKAARLASELTQDLEDMREAPATGAPKQETPAADPDAPEGYCPQCKARLDTAIRKDGSGRWWKCPTHSWIKNPVLAGQEPATENIPTAVPADESTPYQAPASDEAQARLRAAGKTLGWTHAQLDIWIQAELSGASYKDADPMTRSMLADNLDKIVAEYQATQADKSPAKTEQGTFK